jgi:hypothetical protein
MKTLLKALLASAIALVCAQPAAHGQAFKAAGVQISTQLSSPIVATKGGFWWDGATSGPLWRKADGTDLRIAAPTLQSAYTNGAAGQQVIQLTSTNKGVQIQDTSPASVGTWGSALTPVFGVTNSSGVAHFLAVDSSGVEIWPQLDSYNGNPLVIGANASKTTSVVLGSGGSIPVSTGSSLTVGTTLTVTGSFFSSGVDRSSAGTFSVCGTNCTTLQLGGTASTAINFALSGATAATLSSTSILSPATSGVGQVGDSSHVWNAMFANTYRGNIDALTTTLLVGGANATSVQVGGTNTTTTSFQISGSTRWTIGSAGTLAPGADNTYGLGSNTLRLTSSYFLTLRSGDTAAADTNGSNLTIVSQIGGVSSAGAAGTGGAILATPSNGGAASSAGAAGIGGIATYSTGGGGAGVAGTNGTSGTNGVSGAQSGGLTLATGSSGTSGAGGTGTSGAGGNGAPGASSGTIGINVGIAAAGGAGGATSGGGAGGTGLAGGNAGFYSFASGGTTRGGAGGIGGNTTAGGNAGAGGTGGSGGQFSVGSGLAANGGTGGAGGTASGGGSNGAGGAGGTGLIVSVVAGPGGTGGLNGGAGATSGTGGGGGSWTGSAGAGGTAGAAGSGTQGNGGPGGAYTTSAGSGGSGLTGGGGGNWTANSGAGGAGGNTNSGDIILNVAPPGGSGTKGRIRFQDNGSTDFSYLPATHSFVSNTAFVAQLGQAGGEFSMVYSRHFHGAGTAPTIAVGASGVQLGVTPSAAVTAGSDAAGTVTITTGTGPTAFVANTAVTVATITFNTAYATTAPRAVVIVPANSTAGAAETGTSGITFYAEQSSTSTTQFVIKAISAGTPSLTASTAYAFAYVAIQ